MDLIEFSFKFGLIKDVPFMFGLALLNCMRENIGNDLDKIMKEFAEKGKSSTVEIISEKRLKLSSDNNIIGTFEFKKRTFYLIGKSTSINA